MIEPRLCAILTVCDCLMTRLYLACDCNCNIVSTHFTVSEGRGHLSKMWIEILTLLCPSVSTCFKIADLSWYHIYMYILALLFLQQHKWLLSCMLFILCDSL